MSEARIHWISGPVLRARTSEPFHMQEAVGVGSRGLLGEVVQLSENEIVAQVYEDTTGLKPGDRVSGSGEPLSVRLGPGLLGHIFDGLLRPLDTARDPFIRLGAAPMEARRYAFEPLVHAGQRVRAGQTIGAIHTPRPQHCLAPPGASGTVLGIAAAGEYSDAEAVAQLQPETTAEATAAITLTMSQRWPVETHTACNRAPSRFSPDDHRTARPRYAVSARARRHGRHPRRLRHRQDRPAAPLAKWCDADIIVYVGCGERGNEMAEVLEEFPSSRTRAAAGR